MNSASFMCTISKIDLPLLKKKNDMPHCLNIKQVLIPFFLLLHFYFICMMKNFFLGGGGAWMELGSGTGEDSGSSNSNYICSKYLSESNNSWLFRIRLTIDHILWDSLKISPSRSLKYIFW